MSSSEKSEFFSQGDHDQHNPSSSIHRDDLLVVGTGGRVYCLDKHRQGARVWKAKADPQCLGLETMISVFITDQDKVITGGDGRTSAYDLYTGRHLWTHKMKGLFIEQVGAICTPSRALEIQDASPQQPPSYDLPKTIVISCTNGKVVAIDAATGRDLWLFKCPNGGSRPTALVDPPTYYHRLHHVYVGCAGWIYCLHAHTGALQWTSRVRSSILVYVCEMTIVSPWSSRLSAEAHTSPNHFPHDEEDDE